MHKIHLDNIKEYVGSIGYSVVEFPETSKDPINMLCSQGHPVSLRLDKLKSGRRCHKCENPIKTMLCETCGKPFTVNLNKKIQGKYCSHPCYSKSLSKEDVICKCKFCNNNFIQKRKGQEYCNLDCLSQSKIHPVETVYEILSNRGYTLLNEDEFMVDKQSIKIKLRCRDGHEFETLWDNFKNKESGCPDCFNSNHFSKAEKCMVVEIRNFSDSLILVENTRQIIPPYELDIYFPDHKLAVEYCGLYWHSTDYKEPRDHRHKVDLCLERGIRLITVFEDEWLNRKGVVLSRIKQALGVKQETIYARKCLIKEVTPKVANELYDKAHLQGKTRGKVHYGLFYQNELIQAMSLGSLSRAHTASNKTIELKRLANKEGFSIVGGASKLFKACEKYAKSNGYTTIRSYNDLRYGKYSNNVYETLGFMKITETKYTPHYVKDGVRYRNQNLRKTATERLTGKTEKQLRQEQGYSLIYDCGHQTWDYTIL
jgi:very-short-patch-repair endonuclease